MVVDVTAQQYEWTLRLPRARARSTSSELARPGRPPARVHLHALDVIHSFWVPEWRIKRDLVPAGPGATTSTTRSSSPPTRSGTYTLVCTELCGFGHATMRAPVVVETPGGVRRNGSTDQPTDPGRRRPKPADDADGRGSERRQRSGHRGDKEGWRRVAAALTGSRAGRGRSGLPILGAAFGFGLVVALRDDLRPRDLPDRADRLPARDRARDHRRRSASWSGSAASTTGSAGRPARRPIPDDHSQHGANSWRDYFKFNTDHKVIGIQYICTTFFFFFIGGLMAMLMRAELAQPGTQIVDPAPSTASSRPTRR